MALGGIVGVRDGKVAYEHIYWDQAGLLAQMVLLDPADLPIVTDTARGCSPTPAKIEQDSTG